VCDCVKYCVSEERKVRGRPFEPLANLKGVYKNALAHLPGGWSRCVRPRPMPLPMEWGLVNQGNPNSREHRPLLLAHRNAKPDSRDTWTQVGDRLRLKCASVEFRATRGLRRVRLGHPLQWPANIPTRSVESDGNQKQAGEEGEVAGESSCGGRRL
jgi:hypothetical protein